MTCNECPKEWRCIMACEEVNRQLCRIDAELEADDGKDKQ